MRIEIPNIGVLEVKPNNEVNPSFFISFNGETILHAEMDLTEEKAKVFVWSEECFKDDDSMGNFTVYEYPATFGGEE